jgi:hypothetical protein
MRSTAFLSRRAHERTRNEKVAHFADVAYASRQPGGCI